MGTGNKNAGHNSAMDYIKFPLPTCNIKLICLVIYEVTVRFFYKLKESKY